MVKVILQPGLRELRGKMGDWTYRRMYGKQTIMKTPDMSNVKWSKAQKANRQRFSQAISYAKQAMANPKARVHYEKAAKKAGRQPFRVAVSDFLQGKNLLEKK
ncbi:MAG TPA: hypothetical protein VFZ43_06375 [Anaerolineales bacterium]